LESYCKLSILKLKIFLSKRPLDLYVRLSESKYVKVASKDTPNPIDTLDDYSKKGLNSLYVKLEDFNNLMVDIESNINNSLEKIDEYSGINQQYDGLADLLEDTKSLVVNLGISELTVQHVDNLIQKTIYSFSKWDSIETLTELLFKKNEYIKSHALLCSFIATSVLKNVDWSSESIKRKVIMASLFQNICLDREDHAKIYSRDEDAFNRLDTYEKDRVLIHPQKAAKLLDYGEFTGFEVAAMVKSHHELPGGVGFPRGQQDSSNLSPLETLFIMSAYFAHRVLISDPKKFDFNREVQDLNEVFYEGQFKKNFEYFLKTFRT
jgi:hypothetical protein|tara:strand:- start:231440 stop:232405 length:966 start_codon:yes stop_codon:yes gene_type:complete